MTQLLDRLWRHARSSAWAATVGVLGLLGSLPGQSSIQGWGASAFDTESRDEPVVAVAATNYTTALMRKDGRVFVQGVTAPSVLATPLVPAGIRVTRMCLGAWGGLLLLSDGTLKSWGATYSSASPVFLPPLPPGLTYTDCSASLRSNRPHNDAHTQQAQ